MSNSPVGWLVEARRLRSAADRINYWENVDAARDSPNAGLSSMLHIFKLLYGLSFENLLKGTIVAQQGAGGEKGRVDKSLITHEISKLLAQLDQSKIKVSAEEAEMLCDLEKYVRWAGRYPLPVSEKEFFVKAYSSKEYEVAKLLWDRLYQNLDRASMAATDPSGWRMYSL